MKRKKQQLSAYSYILMCLFCCSSSTSVLLTFCLEVYYEKSPVIKPTSNMVCYYSCPTKHVSVCLQSNELGVVQSLSKCKKKKMKQCDDFSSLTLSYYLLHLNSHRLTPLEQLWLISFGSNIKRLAHVWLSYMLLVLYTQKVRCIVHL